MSQVKRLFVGLQIYGDQANDLAGRNSIMATAYPDAPRARAPWEPDGNGHRHRLQCDSLDIIPHHITLHFLGATDSDGIGPLSVALNQVAMWTAPFSPRLADPDTLPDRNGTVPKVAWIGCGSTPRVCLPSPPKRASCRLWPKFQPAGAVKSTFQEEPR